MRGRSVERRPLHGRGPEAYVPEFVAPLRRPGNNNIFGGPGNNRISGGRGDERISGGRGNDTLSGGPGNDTLFGGRGDDRISGGRGNNTIYGGPGNDTIHARNGHRDVIDCGPGRDVAFVDPVDLDAAASVLCGEANSPVASSAATESHVHRLNRRTVVPRRSRRRRSAPRWCHRANSNPPAAIGRLLS